MANPAIFERMRALPNVTSAVIHLHGGNITAQYARAGANRTRVAEIIRQMYGDSLTARQRNNLYIQQQIGRLQQGMPVPVEAFTRFPCDGRLYAKLLVYAAAALADVRATPYRSGG